jgi:hypothetical protein
MYLHRDDIEKMAIIIKNFPDCEVFEVEQDGSSGIGNVTTIAANTKLGELDGKFIVTVSAEEDW